MRSIIEMIYKSDSVMPLHKRLPIQCFHAILSYHTHICTLGSLFRPTLSILAKFFILNLPPIPLYGLIATRLLRGALKRGLSCVQLSSPATPITSNLLTYSYWLIPSKSLPHIHHPALALSVALFELLAFRGQRVDERRTKAVRGFVAVDHHAIGFLEALRECSS